MTYMSQSLIKTHRSPDSHVYAAITYMIYIVYIVTYMIYIVYIVHVHAATQAHDAWPGSWRREYVLYLLHVTTIRQVSILTCDIYVRGDMWLGS